MTAGSGEAVRIEGLRGTVKRLKAFEPELGAEVKALNREAAGIVAATAFERAPVGKAEQGDKHPGRLRDSIRVGATLLTAFVRAGSTKVPYAPPIHWGWYRRGIQPQPFMYEALDARREQVALTYERQIAKLTAKVEGTTDG